MATTIKPLTVETATAGVDRAEEALANLETRIRSGVAVSPSELSAARDILEIAGMVLDGALDRAARQERAAVEAQQALATAEIVADESIGAAALNAILQTGKDAVGVILHELVQLVAARDHALAERVIQARQVGLTECAQWAGSSDFEQVPGQMVSPAGDGLMVDGVEIHVANPAVRRRWVFEALTAGLLDADQADYRRQVVADFEDEDDADSVAA